MAETLQHPAHYADDHQPRSLRDLVPAGETGQSDAADAVARSGRMVAELVRRAAVGDRTAWNDLVDRFAPTVWAIARAHRLNTADAADVSQTTWLRLLENLDRLRQPEQVGGWLATTARRESLRVLRLSNRQIPDGRDFLGVPDDGRNPSDAEALIGGYREKVLGLLVSQLPVRSQLLLRLLSVDSPLSYKEISKSLDMPIGSIGPTRGRALEQLRRLAVKAGIDLRDLRV